VRLLISKRFLDCIKSLQSKSQHTV